MKRICIVLLAVLASGIQAFAQQLNESQKKLRSDIILFLKEEGYVPEIDSDGDVGFKKEGIQYYVMIDGRDTAPLYLSIALFYNYDDKHTAANIADALKDLNFKKGVKVLCSEKVYSYRAEMYLVNAEQFKYTFYKLMDQIAAAKTELNERCDRVRSSATAAYDHSPASSLQAFFPVYGFTLGKTSCQDAERMGHQVKKTSSGNDPYCDVKSLAFWDQDDDQIFESIYMTHSDVIPTAWEEKFGFDWRLSYTEWVALLKKLGFSVRVTDQPTTKAYQERKTLSAKIEAISGDQRLRIALDFSYGNNNNEGYSVNSKNTLYSMDIKAL